MGSILASEYVERANDVLNDVLSTRWGDPTLLAYLNDGQLAVVAKRPDANVVNGAIQCQARALQTIPEDGMRLLEVWANSVSGEPITQIDVKVLNEQVPAWRKVTHLTNRIEHYVYDERDPKHFYVYPTPIASHRIDIVYSAAPEKASSLASVVALDDVYFNPLLDYMLFRAYSRDAENQANAARAASHLQAFEVALGGKLKADAAASPRNV